MDAREQRKARRELVEQRSAELTNLRVAAVKQQRTGESGAAAASDGAAGTAAAGTGGVSAAHGSADGGSASELEGAGAIGRPAPISDGTR